MSTATARLFSHSKISKTRIRIPLLQENPVHLVLILLALLSSLTLIYIKDLNRRLFIQYQKYEAAYDKKVREQEQLVLEKTTWSTHNRIQMLASEKLGMMLPSYDKTIVIKTNTRKNNLMHASKQTNEKPA